MLDTRAPCADLYTVSIYLASFHLKVSEPRHPHRRCSRLLLMCQVKLLLSLIVSVTVLHTSLGAQHKEVHQHLDSLEDYTGSGNSIPTRVIFDHDAGIDDFITLMLLLSQPDRVELLGVTIIEGDCIADVAVNTTLKMLHLLGHHDIPIALSTLAAVNPFPMHYRAQTLSMDVLPVLNHQNPADVEALRRRLLQPVSGQEYFAQLLLQQTEPVSIIMTGPLSNLAYALDRYPSTVSKISRVWWMGGALRVPGNVYEANNDGSAEWNAYWDPAALGVVWNSSVPLTLVPLDGTNKVPITPDLLYSFGPQASYLYSNLAGTLYAPVADWVFHQGTVDVYYAWDVLTAACMLHGSQLCEMEHGLQVAAVTKGPGQGATVLVNQTQHLGVGMDARLAAGQVQEIGVDAAVEQSARILLQGDGTLDMHEEDSNISPGAALAAAAAIATAAAKQGRRILDRTGVDVSAVKKISAVVDVDAQEFKRLILNAFRR